jgi:hypothetical protein
MAADTAHPAACASKLVHTSSNDIVTYLSLRSSCAAQHQSLIKTQGCAAVQGCSQNFSEPLPLFPVPCSQTDVSL